MVGDIIECPDCELEFEPEYFCNAECPRCGREYETEYGIGFYYIMWSDKDVL